MATSVRPAFCKRRRRERAVADDPVIADRLVDDQAETIAWLELAVEVHLAGEDVGKRHREIGRLACLRHRRKQRRGLRVDGSAHSAGGCRHRIRHDLCREVVGRGRHRQQAQETERVDLGTRTAGRPLQWNARRERLARYAPAWRRRCLRWRRACLRRRRAPGPGPPAGTPSSRRRARVPQSARCRQPARCPAAAVVCVASHRTPGRTTQPAAPRRAALVRCAFVALSVV